eukprot:GHRQ01033869.1.p1 GENE.GHRQ01033869.1~~GHRQ01033869.1.p1  ORF type:complete len:129 (+),score=27.96 GHRQ01033869.1:213-599(+)
MQRIKHRNSSPAKVRYRELGLPISHSVRGRAVCKSVITQVLYMHPRKHVSRSMPRVVWVPSLMHNLCHTHIPLMLLLQELPEAPRELVEELSRRYVHLYERITGQQFAPPPLEQPVGERMLANMAKYL